MAVYNGNALVHSAKDAEKIGSLENVSAFPYENFLGRLKGLIRKQSFPLEQVIRRLSEKTSSVVADTFLNKNTSVALYQIFSQLGFSTGLFRLTGTSSSLIEPHRDKTGFLPMRKQRRRSASR